MKLFDDLHKIINNVKRREKKMSENQKEKREGRYYYNDLLLKVRKSRGKKCSQSVLAKELGISTHTVSNYERGLFPIKDVAILKKLAEYFNEPGFLEKVEDILHSNNGKVARQCATISNIISSLGELTEDELETINRMINAIRARGVTK